MRQGWAYMFVTFLWLWLGQIQRDGEESHRIGDLADALRRLVCSPASYLRSPTLPPCFCPRHAPRHARCIRRRSSFACSKTHHHHWSRWSPGLESIMLQPVIAECAAAARWTNSSSSMTTLARTTC